MKTEIIKFGKVKLLKSLKKQIQHLRERNGELGDEMKKYTLLQRMSLDLDVKVRLSEKRIQEWYDHNGGQVYISFSGGKDSTVLLHLVRSIYPNVPAVFCDTGLEFPEIRDFVKSTPNVTWLKPRHKFREVISKYGFPIVSKETSCYIDQYRNTKKESLREKRWSGKVGKIPEKWKFLVKAPFKISDRCCYVMKKSPFKSYENKEKLFPYIGTMATDSNIRKINYLRYGCNAFNIKRPISTPMAFWTEENVWEYIKSRKIPYSDIYKIGYKRTGCMFCMFGLHMEKESRFKLLEKTHPKQYQYCMDKLGLREVLKFLKKEKI